MHVVRSGLVFFCLLAILLLIPTLLTAQTPAPVAGFSWNWQVVVNNGVIVPGDVRTFNSYNQPSLNVNRLVVFRARSKGGVTGEPAHGIFTRDMSPAAADPMLRTFFDRNTLVPQPNNLGATFIEPPAFPRIDMWSNTIATRAGHMPTWEYVVSSDPVTGEVTTTRVGTTGIYTNAFGSLILGMSNLGNAPEFDFFRVPEVLEQAIKFDVFPGAPAVADSKTLAVKGNYSVPDPTNPAVLIGKTGVYYRTLANAPMPSNQGDLSPAGGTAPFVLIANSDTPIPGTGVPFGSTAPPSAVGNRAVFAGFDNEDAPTLGGIYLAPLSGTRPPLTTLVKIGDRVPGEDPIYTFNKLSEGLSFDGRFVAFWGAWGSEVKELVLQCPSDGNKNRVKYCKDLYGDGVNPGSVSAGFHTTIPLHQGIFVHDTSTGKTRAVAKTPTDFADFV